MRRIESHRADNFLCQYSNIGNQFSLDRPRSLRAAAGEHPNG